MSRFGNESFFLALNAIEAKAKMDRICNTSEEILTCLKCDKVPEYKYKDHHHIISCKTCGSGSVHKFSKRIVIEQWNESRGLSCPICDMDSRICNEQGTCNKTGKEMPRKNYLKKEHI